MRDARDVWRGLEIGATHRTGNSAVSSYLQRFLVFRPIIGHAAWCFATSKLPFYVCKVEKDDEARAAAVGLLARGLMTPGQAARFAGVSRQLVRHWLKAAGIDWKRAWDRRQAGLWRREIAGLQGKALRPPTKAQMRKQIAAAIRRTKRASQNGAIPRRNGPIGASEPPRSSHDTKVE
jgi:hypothetical protein